MNLRVAVLTAAAGLTDESTLALGRGGERFLVGDLRLADARLDAELALEAIDDDLEMQLAHAGDDHLAGLLVGADAERRIFRHQLRHAVAELFLIRLGLRLDGERDHRLRKIHRLEQNRLLLVGQGVAGRDRLEAHGRGDVAREHFLDLFPLVRVHLQEPADALRLALRGIEHRRAGGEPAGIDAEERELTDERVGHDLERERRERLFVVGSALDLRAFFFAR